MILGVNAAGASARPRPRSASSSMKRTDASRTAPAGPGAVVGANETVRTDPFGASNPSNTPSDTLSLSDSLSDSSGAARTSHTTE